MAEIGFYHLTRSAPGEALPPLLGRTLESGERAVIRCRDLATVKQLDDALWKAKSPLWLPHGSRSQGHAARQPIWLTESDDVPNEARFLFLTDAAPDHDLARFARVFVLFDGQDEAALTRARTLWSRAREEGHELAYWQQQAQGWRRAK